MIFLRVALLLIGCPMFALSMTYYIYVKIKQKPKEDLDDYYYEFENQHPDLDKYYRKTTIAFTIAIISMLMVFLAVIPF